MNTNKTDSSENDDLQRFYRAMAILRQKIDTLLKSTPELLNINNLAELPSKKAEIVEDQLWNIFAYGEYYVEKLRADCTEKSIVSASEAGIEHFDYHQKQYKSFTKKLKGLIDVSNAPERKEVEIEILNEIDDGYFSNEPPKEITETDIYIFFASEDIDRYEEIASKGWLQNYIRTHVGGHTSTSDGNMNLKTCFYNIICHVRISQNQMESQGGPRIDEIQKLCEPGAVIKKENANDRGMYDLPIEGCEKIIGESYFQPDEWVANEKELSPVIVDRERKQIPQRIQERIREIRSSFIFGNWMSVIALSRCLLEYAIIDRNSSLLKLELYKNEDKKWRKPLGELVDDAKKSFPEMEKGERIIEAGNRVMHPSPDGTLSKFPPGKADAKDCIDGITTIISTLYSKPKNSGNPLIKPITNTR